MTPRSTTRTGRPYCVDPAGAAWIPPPKKYSLPYTTTPVCLPESTADRVKIASFSDQSNREREISEGEEVGDVPDGLDGLAEEGGGELAREAVAEIVHVEHHLMPLLPSTTIKQSASDLGKLEPIRSIASGAVPNDRKSEKGEGRALTSAIIAWEIAEPRRFE